MIQAWYIYHKTSRSVPYGKILSTGYPTTLILRSSRLEHMNMTMHPKNPMKIIKSMIIMAKKKNDPTNWHPLPYKNTSRLPFLRSHKFNLLPNQNNHSFVYSIREQRGAGYHDQNFRPVFVPTMWLLLRIRPWPGTSLPMKRSNYITSCYPSFIKFDIFKHLQPKSLITDAITT